MHTYIWVMVFGVDNFLNIFEPVVSVANVQPWQEFRPLNSHALHVTLTHLAQNSHSHVLGHSFHAFYYTAQHFREATELQFTESHAVSANVRSAYTA